MFDKEERYWRSRLFFRPVTALYFLILLLWMLFLLPMLLLLIGPLFVYGLGLSPELTISMFLLSLLGSCVNIPVKEVVSVRPIVTFRRASFFGVVWTVPELGWSRQRTVIAVNVGGALVPMALSLYLLLRVIPMSEINPLVTYAKVLIALAVVTLFVNRLARPIEGLGIATPGFIPPFITAMVALFLFRFYVPSNPCIITYISGTMGTLLGADLFNLDEIPRLGAPVVSIGGAGTFDGIYITGVVSLLLVLLLL